jgi:hypothetical protein
MIARRLTSVLPGARLACNNSARMSTLRKARPKVAVIGAGWAGFRFLQDVDKDKYDGTCAEGATRVKHCAIALSCYVPLTAGFLRLDSVRDQPSESFPFHTAAAEVTSCFCHCCQCP